MNGLAKLFGDALLPASLLPFLQLGLGFPDSPTLQPGLVLVKLLRGWHWAREPRKCAALLMPLFSGWEINTWETVLEQNCSINCSTIDTQWSVTLNTTEIPIWWMQWVGWKAEKSGFQLVYGHVDRCENLKKIHQPNEDRGWKRLSFQVLL